MFTTAVQDEAHHRLAHNMQAAQSAATESPQPFIPMQHISRGRAQTDPGPAAKNAPCPTKNTPELSGTKRRCSSHSSSTAQSDNIQVSQSHLEVRD